MDFEIRYRQCTIIQERNFSVFAENLPLSLPSKPMFLKNTSLTIRAETRASESTEILVLKPSIARPTVHHTKISLTWRAGERAFEPVPGGPIKKENGPFSRATGFFSAAPNHQVPGARPTAVSGTVIHRSIRTR